MASDESVARELRRSVRRAWALGSVGALVVFGFIVFAVVDPGRAAPAIDADRSPAGAAAAEIALTAGVVLLIVATIGMARVGRQRRAIARSPFRRVPVRWMRTAKRGQVVDGLALQQPDHSWLALTLTPTFRSRQFAQGVRASGVADVALLPGYAVVRAPESTVLVSAKPKGVVAEPPPPVPNEPIVTLRAAAPVAGAPAPVVDGVWFREATAVPVGLLLRSLGVLGILIFSVVRSAIDGDLESVGSIAVSVFVLAAGSSGPAALLVLHTVTTVDRAGVTRRRLGRKPNLVAFEGISTVARYATVGPRIATKVVLTLDDASTVTILTRRPDDLIAALRMGRPFV